MKNKIKCLSLTFLIVIMCSFSNTIVFAHSLEKWAEKYPNTSAGGEYQFGISNCFHVNGNTVYYHWDKTGTKNIFGKAFNYAVQNWNGLISAIETTKGNEQLLIEYNPNYAIKNTLAITSTPEGYGHYAADGVTTTMTLAHISKTNETEQASVIAHELGHVWGIDDLYTIGKKDLASIYSDFNKFTTPTRHDRNAMRICLNSPWFENADGTMKYQKSPGVWANNEWLTINGNDYYFKGQTKCDAYKITYIVTGGGKAPAMQTKFKNENITLSNQKPTRTYTIKYKTTGGSLSYTSKNVSATFKGWNTNLKGTGTSYSPGAVYTQNNTLTLYSQWTNPNAGNFPTATRPYYIFDGWYNAKKGGNKVTTSTVVKGDVTYYARWNASTVMNRNTSYTANINTAGQHKYFRFKPDKDGAYQISSDSDINPYVELYTNNNLTYQLANDDNSGNGNNFSLTYWLKAGKTYYFDTKLFGNNKTGKYNVKIVSYDGATYKIDFNGAANDATQIPASEAKVSMTSYTLPEEEPARTNYAFLGWDTNKAAYNPTYYKINGKYNKKYTNNQSVQFFAIWGLLGDVDRDNSVKLADAQLALKIATWYCKTNNFSRKTYGL